MADKNHMHLNYNISTKNTTRVSPSSTDGAYSGSPGSAKWLTNCAMPAKECHSQYHRTSSALAPKKKSKYEQNKTNIPVYGRHFLLSIGGLYSKGSRGSNSFKRLAVRPVGWLCPICNKNHHRGQTKKCHRYTASQKHLRSLWSSKK